MTRRRCRSVTALVTLGTAVLTVAGCTTAVSGQGRMAAGARPSASPTASPSPEVVDAGTVVLHARNAMCAAPAIDVHGVAFDHGVSQAIDVRVGYDNDDHYQTEGHAVVAAAGRTAVEEIGVGLASWVKAPAAYWNAYGLPADLVHTVDNRWVKVPHDVGRDTLLVSLVGLTKFLLPDSADDVALVRSRTVGGRSLQAITDARLPGNTYLFEPGDQPRLVEIVSAYGALLVTYPTGLVTVTAPAPAEVVTLPGD